MNRMLIVSNRLPITIVKRKNSITYSPSSGGLATGLASFYKSYKSLWIGWPGIITNNIEEKHTIEKKLVSENMNPVFLTNNQIKKYYYGFSNNTIWPLFHYFTQYAVYDENTWGTYRDVNKMFCDEIVKTSKPGDTIWIHDYQLMLLPQLIREKLPEATIGFFLHIPFPSFEIFRLLPWRNDILKGMLGADLVGFHTYDYARHFLSSVMRLLGYDKIFNKITFDDRIVKVESFPMGIDYEKFAYADNKKEIKNEILKISKKIGDRKNILSIDRLDYSKGIPQRLKAFDVFLEKYPECREKISLILVVVPSRSKIKQYRELKIEIDELVGRINGKYAAIGYTPIFYFYRSLPFETMSAIYNIVDVALVTPFRDGMNLIAKEYVASKKNSKGVLILSETAGASQELGDAIIINPNDINEIVNALHTALSLSEDEQIKRNQSMQAKLKRNNVIRWTDDFIDALKKIKEQQKIALVNRLTHQLKEKLVSDYHYSKNRMIFLDYDGTLVSFAKTPDKAIPDAKLLDLLRALTKSSRNKVVIISGRDKKTLQEWFGDLNLALVAEHGAWLRTNNRSWETIEPLTVDWKEDIQPILEVFVDRTPGSLIEEKEFSLVWHYRKVDQDLAQIRSRELVDTLVYLTANLNLQILEGSKVIEIKNSGINKGRAALQWISKNIWDFILAIGDDWTDEELFKVLPENAYSIKVGFSSTAAKFNIKSPNEVRRLLTELLKETYNDEDCK